MTVSLTPEYTPPVTLYNNNYCVVCFCVIDCASHKKHVGVARRFVSPFFRQGEGTTFSIILIGYNSDECIRVDYVNTDTYTNVHTKPGERYHC